MKISVEFLNSNKSLLNTENLVELGGKLICSDSFGNELWNFGDNENPLYVQRHIDLNWENDDIWSSDNLGGWFVFSEDDKWIEHKLK